MKGTLWNTHLKDGWVLIPWFYGQQSYFQGQSRRMTPPIKPMANESPTLILTRVAVTKPSFSTVACISPSNFFFNGETSYHIRLDKLKWKAERRGTPRCGGRGRIWHYIGQASYLGKGKSEGVFLMEVENPSLVEKVWGRKSLQEGWRRQHLGSGGDVIWWKSFQFTNTREPWGARPCAVELSGI